MTSILFGIITAVRISTAAATCTLALGRGPLHLLSKLLNRLGERHKRVLVNLNVCIRTLQVGFAFKVTIGLTVLGVPAAILGVVCGVGTTVHLATMTVLAAVAVALLGACLVLVAVSLGGTCLVLPL